MLPRFLVPDFSANSDLIVLPAEEANHLTRVLRLRVGDDVGVFDGGGRQFRARVHAIAKREVTLQRLEPLEAAPEATVSLILAQAVLKGEKMDEVVRDAVILGVTAIQPIISARTEIALQSIVRARRVERWRRVAVASTKQCGRAVLPPIHDPIDLTTFLASVRVQLRIMLVEPSGGAVAGVAAIAREPKPATAALLSGPEGGWAKDELDVARRHQFLPVTLGGRVFRAEVAPIVGTTVLQFLWGEL